MLQCWKSVLAHDGYVMVDRCDSWWRNAWQLTAYDGHMEHARRGLQWAKEVLDILVELAGTLYNIILKAFE